MRRHAVTGVSSTCGRPVIVSDAEPPRTRRLTHTPGFARSPVRNTTAPAAPPATRHAWRDNASEPATTCSVLLGAGGAA